MAAAVENLERVVADDAISRVLDYHQATKHHLQRYAPGPAFLDWDSQPDPFRRFEGAPLIELPFSAGDGCFSYQDLYSAGAGPAAPSSLADIGNVFELALGLSAWKSSGPDRWALRNNPSSGNLHPTEAYLLLWRQVGDALSPGLYHYAAREHALEKRADLPRHVAEAVADAAAGSFGAIGLSSVIWREEWKYGPRALRYCQLDLGHALGSLRFAAQVQGWTLSVDRHVGDAVIERCLGLDRSADFKDCEPEHPDILATLGHVEPGRSVPWPQIAGALCDWRGSANRLSNERVAWPEIAAVAPSLRKEAVVAKPDSETGCERRSFVQRPGSSTTKSAESLIRGRRSAQRMDGKTGISLADFETMLARTIPSGDAPPFDVVGYPPALNLLVFVHAVDGLAPGLYLLNRVPERFEAFRASCGAPDLSWSPVTRSVLPLYALSAETDVRRLASTLSCHQGIAGRGAFSLGMLADFDGVIASEGAWAYRRLFWEAGLIGQVLYLEAEAAGLSGTGIGCFFDDEVTSLLGLPGGRRGPWQSIYHFTVGRSVADNRLQTEPAYAHLGQRAPTNRTQSGA